MIATMHIVFPVPGGPAPCAHLTRLRSRHDDACASVPVGRVRRVAQRSNRCMRQERAQSRCRCGQSRCRCGSRAEPNPGADVAGAAEPSPGADVPSPGDSTTAAQKGDDGRSGRSGLRPSAVTLQQSEHRPLRHAAAVDALRVEIPHGLSAKAKQQAQHCPAERAVFARDRAAPMRTRAV